MYQKLCMGTLLLLVVSCGISRASDLKHVVCKQTKFKSSSLNEEDLEMMDDAQRSEIATREDRFYSESRDLTHIEQLKLFIELGNDIRKLSSQDIIFCKENSELYNLLGEKGIFIDNEYKIFFL